MIRVGDLVSYFPLGENRRRVGIVEGTAKDFWCIRGHIDVNGQIVPIKEKDWYDWFGCHARKWKWRKIIVIKKREKIKKWWTYLNLENHGRRRKQ